MIVYVLRSKIDDSFYVGSTRDLNRRLKSHNNGENFTTKKKIPWVLVRIENYCNTTLALKRERFLKTGKGREILRNLCPSSVSAIKALADQPKS